MRKISLYENALPDPLFQRLLKAVMDVGNEGASKNGGYSTTFWFPLGMEPRNVAEEVALKLYNLVEPGPECVGMEWWLGRLRYGKSLRMHFDRDLSLKKKTGESVHPLWSSVLYLNEFPSSPTVILDQVLDADGKTRIPARAKYEKAVDPIPNHYTVFPGGLRHGVVARPAGSEPAGVSHRRGSSSERRLTLMVNYWHKRPSAPVCIDYDGSIYGALQDEKRGLTAVPGGRDRRVAEPALAAGGGNG